MNVNSVPAWQCTPDGTDGTAKTVKSCVEIHKSIICMFLFLFFIIILYSFHFILCSITFFDNMSSLLPGYEF